MFLLYVLIVVYFRHSMSTKVCASQGMWMRTFSYFHEHNVGARIARLASWLQMYLIAIRRAAMLIHLLARMNQELFPFDMWPSRPFVLSFNTPKTTCDAYNSYSSSQSNSDPTLSKMKQELLSSYSRKERVDLAKRYLVIDSSGEFRLLLPSFDCFASFLYEPLFADLQVQSVHEAVKSRLIMAGLQKSYRSVHHNITGELQQIRWRWCQTWRFDRIVPPGKSESRVQYPANLWS
jgi:hypothetical protein